ncbi:F-box/kelch-repeat protein At3g23880-like [Silene latifolia]|uniref:F-box/kelch-repeat protein At3g23880-like n=1 Tax=Silene latifolia TaxID=37657 RepID=UPI003D779131
MVEDAPLSDVNPYFSQDIWFEILKNLPVKTLGKFRCVCKSWCSLIVSPTFMAAHLKHYTQNNCNSLILHKKKSANGYYEHCVQFRDSDQLKEHNSIPPASICDYTWPYSHLFCSVYCLLCVSGDNNLCILIWNPILEKCITLPRTTIRDRVSVVGFGYDCRKSDHRVVVIYFSTTKSPLVEVFSVQERTRRIISADYLVDNSIISHGYLTSANCFVNGFIHWFIWDSKSRPKALLLFNVSDDKFETMELPEAITNMENVESFCIFEHQGMLSVSPCDPSHYWGTDVARCHIWVKREYNDVTSWFKILDVTPLPGFYPTGPMQYMGKNGELIVFTKKFSDGAVCLDMTDGHLKELGFRITQYTTRLSAYSESLVFLDQQISDYIDDYMLNSDGNF